MLSAHSRTGRAEIGFASRHASATTGVFSGSERRTARGGFSGPFGPSGRSVFGSSATQPSPWFFFSEGVGPSHPRALRTLDDCCVLAGSTMSRPSAQISFLRASASRSTCAASMGCCMRMVTSPAALI